MYQFRPTPHAAIFFLPTDMNFLKCRSSKDSTNPTHKKRRGVIHSSDDDSDNEDSGHKQTSQPSNQDNEIEVIDTTEAENAKRQEAVNKIS